MNAGHYKGARCPYDPQDDNGLDRRPKRSVKKRHQRDVPPEMYGEKTASDKVSTKPRRSQFEWAITKGAVERNIPILGICGGQQLLNVILTFWFWATPIFVDESRFPLWSRDPR